MAKTEHLEALKKGVAYWNTWRQETKISYPELSGSVFKKTNLTKVNLSNANLTGADFTEADLTGADLTGANLTGANLTKVNLKGVNFTRVNLYEADLTDANLNDALLTEADLTNANLTRANFTGANLRGANLYGTNLTEVFFLSANLTRVNLYDSDLTKTYCNGANFLKANLSDANLSGLNLSEVNFSNALLTRANIYGAVLTRADLSYSNLSYTNLSCANLSGANLSGTICIGTNFTYATLDNANIYGISVWNIQKEGLKQQNLIITTYNEPIITVDSIEVAQFIYLILNNQKIRDVIGTIAQKGVLILGRFTPERKKILDAIRDKLREYDFVPIMFDFEKVSSRDFTETIKILAGMSRFVIADITNPKSAPLELQATVPDYKIPFLPIVQKGEPPFSMFDDLRQKYNWVLPTMSYNSEEALLRGFKKGILDKALEADRRLYNEKQAPPPKMEYIEDFEE